MSKEKLKFKCPKCGTTYALSFSTGPLMNCPKCQYDPTFAEIMKSGGPSRWWFVLIAVLALGRIAFATFATGLFR